MQPILAYYLAGLTIALVIGVVCYYVVGFAATPLLTALFGPQAGRMWGRLFRMSVVMIALVGGLSSKFYGCGGPTDYAAVASSHPLMRARTSEQIRSSLRYSMHYLVLAGALGGIAFAVLHRGRIRRE